MGVDTAKRERTEPLNPPSLQDRVHIDLTPHDVWVLGQLIEADTANLPRTMRDHVLNGYRILKATGYEPPPTGNPPNVGLTAPQDEASLADPGLETPRREPREAVVREVLITEVESHEPAPSSSVDEPPAQASLQPAETVAPALERVASAVEELTEEVALQQDADTTPTPRTENAPTRQLSPGVVFDTALVTCAVFVATLFTTAAAILHDPVFAALAIGLTAAAAWFIVPWIREESPEGPA